MAATVSSSCSPSSSAVTIPVPGKSILKRPPPTNQSLLSRFTRFLPNQNQQQGANSDEAKPLKRAHFILPQIATVYPISSLNPPSTPTLKDEKRTIEDREAERRKKVVRGNSVSSGPGDPDEWWNMDKVESFYRECCTSCDDLPEPLVSAVLKKTPNAGPRFVDFSGVRFDVTSATILSDVFTIEWGLRKLVFRDCDLDDLILKPILHSLLIPNTLSYLSVAANKRLKAPAFRLIGAYVANAKSLQFLDLSNNALDKKSIEYIVVALATAPTPGLTSLRLDDCSLRPAALEVLCRAVRTSSLNHISLRQNRITQASGVALALMIRDYPDVVPQQTPLSSSNATPSSSVASSPASSTTNLPVNSPPVTPLSTTHNPPLPPPPQRTAGPLQPPPRHPSAAVQTTYTPYIPRSKRNIAPTSAAVGNPLSATGQPIPIITSSSQGGVTTRHVIPNGTHGPGHEHGVGGASRYDAGPSAALLDKVRALDALPRVGALRTLDLEGNDLRMGVSYLAQVLKRNRTLKNLNLRDNKLDVQCLVVVAEALKYNSCLEMLDMSKNPCCGPMLEGIQSLRTAFTLNTALKRLFLSNTNLSSTGAIALAEFLPESTSLIHLDLTENNLDIAGVMALSSGLKANYVMRCLDLNIPPADEEFARMCRDILSSCVRNTERAQKVFENSNFHPRPLGKGIWAMIEESELARSIRRGNGLVDTDVELRAKACIAELNNVHALCAAASVPSTPTSTNAPLASSTTPAATQAPPPAPTPTPSAARLSIPPRHKAPSPEIIQGISDKSKAVGSDLITVIQETEDPGRIEELFGIHEQLLGLIERLPPPPPPPPEVLLKRALSLSSQGSSRTASPAGSTASLLGAGGAGSGSGSSSSASSASGGSAGGRGELRKLEMTGLGIHMNGGGELTASPVRLSPLSSVQSSSEHLPNGLPALGEGIAAGAVGAGEDDDDDLPLAPRLDKGKAKAEPEPEEPEKVLSPTFMITEDDDEDGEDDEGGVRYMVPEGGVTAPSPSDRSRSWVEEEGEVFRKGTVLLGPEEMEGEYAGEELRKEVC
ncbi:hypothetical protein AX16_010912 [Volvariella volvacea WC 439]|nr:hypothetical protein AX16_010912 [Volvariella volvacea WC 439]